MFRRLPPAYVSVTLTVGREPDHLLTRELWLRGRLRTCCGLAPYYDGLGRQIVARRDGRKVRLRCHFCRAHLRNLIASRSYTDQGGLFEG